MESLIFNLLQIHVLFQWPMRERLLVTYFVTVT